MDKPELCSCTKVSSDHDHDDDDDDDGGGDDDDGGDDDIVPFTKSITHYYSCSVKAVRRKNINLNIPEITLSYINQLFKSRK